MTLPAPAHVNQLSAGGRFPSGPYAGKASGPYDCMVAAGIMAIDAFTGGAVRPSASEFRARQHDQDHNGIGLGDVADAWKTYGLTMRAGLTAWPSISARLNRGDGAIVAGNYGALAPYRAPGSNFAGPHALYLQRTAGTKGILVNDPLRNGPTYLPAGAVMRFYLTGAAQAGWGTGVGVGASSTPLGPPAPTPSGGTPAGAQLKAILDGMKLTDPAHRITHDEAFAIAVALQGGANTGYTPQLAGAYENRTVGQVLATANASIIPDIPGAITAAGDQLSAAIGQGLVDVLVNGTIIVAIAALGWSGLKKVTG